MPFRSEAQRRYLFAKEPEMAKRWAKKYGSKVKHTYKKGSPNTAVGNHCLKTVGALS